VAQDGRTIVLHDYLGSRNVVLYFYVKDFTIGCTAESKDFSASYETIRRLGAEVLGVSSDSSESHAGFANECGVNFPLLSDKDGKVRKSYGVKASFGFLPGRVTFVIDKEGIVRKVFSSQVNPRRHVSEAIEALKSISA